MKLKKELVLNFWLFEKNKELILLLLSPCQLFVMNISQIKHTWFSFDFLFVTDLSNYNAGVFTGKRLARMEGIQAFILSMKRESQNQA